MVLPNLQPDGVLPIGGHAASVGEVEAMFVDTAPAFRPQRVQLWSAFLLWRDRAQHHFGHGTVWLSGSFVTHWTEVPTLRLVFFPDTPSMVDTAIKRGDVGLGLLTLEDVLYAGPGSGGHVTELRVVGGMMDAQLGQVAEHDGWSTVWSMIPNRRRELIDAGYVMVRA